MSVNKVDQSTGELSPIAGGTLYADAPVGSIQAYGGTTAPWGWLLCQGQAISRTTYAELFNVIGTSFGSGDGSTTFNVPDLRGKVPVGYNSSESEFNTLGKTGGTKTVTLTAAQIPAHTHPLGYAGNIYAGSGPTGFWTDYDSPTTAYSRNTQANTGGGGAHNNLQPYNTVNYIIKATTIALPSDFEAAVDEKIDDITSIEYNSATLVTQSNYTFTKCQYTKSGHLCTAFIQLNVITNAISEINCASGFPRSAQDGANAHFWAFRWDNFNVDPVGLYINQHGNLLVKGGISGGSSPYVVAFTYITTD